MSDKASGLNLEANSPEKAKAIDPLHSGWLMKKGKVRRNWTKRWFVLMNGILTYSKAANSKAKGSFSVKGVDFMPMTIGTDKYENGIEIRSLKRTFYLRAFSSEELEIWKTKLQEHGAIWIQDIPKSEKKSLSSDSIGSNEQTTRSISPNPQNKKQDLQEPQKAISVEEKISEFESESDEEEFEDIEKKSNSVEKKAPNSTKKEQNYEADNDEHELYELGSYPSKSISNNKQKDWKERSFFLDVDSGLLLSAKSTEKESETSILKTLGRIIGVEPKPESGQPFCIKCELDTQKVFIIDLLTKENFDRILNYIELINIKASQSKARAQKKQMLDIFTLSNEVKVKYGFQNFIPISSMLPNTSVLRKYTLPEYDQASDKGLLEYVETKKTLTENLSTNQESSSSKYINFQYPIPGGRYIQSNYKNQNTYQERTFSNNNNNNSPKNQEKSDNYDKANTISQISTNVKQYKSSYAHVTSLPNEHIEKIEQTPQKKLFTKENWNEIGVSLLQKRKRLNRLGASEVFDYLMSLCTQERNVFQKMLPTLTFDPQKSSDSIDLKQVEKIVTNWRSFSISRFLGETLKTELLINEPGESKEELQPGGVWMEPFGIITDSPFDTSQKGLMLGSLVEDFVTVASSVVRTIIEELPLPISQKTFPPIDVGGIAGGEKYKAHDIFIKLALDSNGIYGGDEYSMKSAKHEFKSTHALYNTLYNVYNPSISVPLMCVIDYKGYRASAMACLPIFHETLIYGSDDGGESFHKCSEEFNEVLQCVCELWNLKPHIIDCENGQESIFACFDLEGHFGKDGRFYICDTARFFPPEKRTSKIPGDIFYRLFRPEFLLYYKKTLSSDSYIPAFCSEKDIDDIEEATNFLFSKVIPKVAASITEIYPLIKEMGYDYLVLLIHQGGVNIRQIGFVRACAPLTDEGNGVRQMLLVEMIARVIKNHFKNQLRETKDPILQAKNSIQFLDDIFGNNSKSTKYWNSAFHQYVERNFYNCLYLKGNSDISSQMSSFFPPFSLFPEIFNRFVLLTGIRIHSEYYKQISNHLTEINPAPFSSSLEELKLLSQDVIQFTSRILCFSSALRLKGHQLRLDASKRLGLTPSMNQYDPQVIEMVNKIRNSVELAPLYNDAKALFSMAVQCDTFDITSEKLLLSIQTFDQKGKKELNKRYFERIASGTVCTWFEDLLRTKIEKKYKEVITGDLEEAEELMKKFISEGFKDLPTVTKAAEKYQCACIKARSFRNNYLIQLRPPPFSIHFASIVESLGRALYYQEYLEKKGVPDLSVSVLLFALEAYRECPAALVCREMAHLNELLSLLFQQLMQPLPSILLEISLLRLIRSIEANYQQCYINLTTLLQAFPKIDSDSSLRFRLMTVIAKMKPKEEGIQTLNYIASLLSSAIPPEELKQILSITEPQIFSYLLDLQDKFRRGEPGNLIRKRLNDANMLLMDAEERERESKLQVDQLLAQMLLHGLFTHSK